MNSKPIKTEIGPEVGRCEEATEKKIEIIN